MNINIFSFLLMASCSFGSLMLQASDQNGYVAEIIMKRYSGIHYDVNQTVSYEQILSLMEAARLAPSSYNDQPWTFLICDKLMTPEQHELVLESLIPSQRKWAEKAQVLAVVLVRKNFEYNQKPNLWAEYDTGAAAENLALQAVELGLMTHSIGGFDPLKLIQNFAIPEGYSPMVVMAIGYEESNQQQQPRKRKALCDNFYFGHWGQSL
jgi:nitroreductase